MEIIKIYPTPKSRAMNSLRELAIQKYILKHTTKGIYSLVRVLNTYSTK